jgi:AraC-like DNA-binding protein
MAFELAKTRLNDQNSALLEAGFLCPDFSASTVHQLNISTKEVQLTKCSLQEGCILLYLNKGGKSSLKISNHSIKFDKAEQNIFNIPSGEILITAQKKTDITLFFLKKEAFENYILAIDKGSENSPDINFRQQFERHLLLKQRVANIITEIAQCEFEAHLKNLYTKAKLIEMITHQLAQSDSGKDNMKLNEVEFEKMRMAKEIIDNNISANFTISELARAVGTNEQYLKKHFKMAYNKTIFGYLTDIRMNHAKHLLSSGKFKVLDVANQVGYMHATHFTKAFKKHFGLLPQKIKNHVLIFSILIFSNEFCSLETLLT